MFYFNQLDTLKYARKLVEDQKKIIGYDPTFYVHVVFLKAHQGRILYVDKVLNWFKKETGFSVEKSSYPNTFEIRFSDLKTKDQIKQKKEKLEFYLTLLSIKTGIGFILNQCVSEGIKYKGQPFSLRIGLEEENFTDPLPTKYEINKWENKCITNDTFKKFIFYMKNFYLQSDSQMRVIIGCAIIEAIFDTSPQPLLTKEEEKKVLATIKNMDLKDEKLKRLSNILKDKNLVVCKGKRERIIDSISQNLNIKYEEIKEMISLIWRIRGHNAHNIVSHKETNKAVKYLEFILKKELECKLRQSN
jgi:hypothetical protein